MNNTKKLTISSITVAFGALFMLIGCAVPQLDLTVSCLSSVLVAFIYIEIGSPYTYLVWLCTTLIIALSFPVSIMWVSYFLVFGIYPVVKGYIEGLPKKLWLIIKISYGIITMAAVFVITTFVLVIETESFFNLPIEAAYIILLVLAVLCFVIYDVFLTAAVRVYYRRIRPKIKNLLK